MRDILIQGRLNKGLDQVEVSRLLDMYDNFCWKYEHGERAIKGPELVRIARLLDIDLPKAVRDIGAAAYDPKESQPTRTGRASTPLAQKLGVLPNMRLFAMHAPSSYAELLEPLPRGAKLVARLTRSTRLIHIFIARRRQLDPLLKKISGRLRADAAIWVSWPKRSSKEYTDVTAEVILDAVLPLGFVEVDMCMVDGTWSALKFVVEKKQPG